MAKYLAHPSDAEAVAFDIDGVLVNSLVSIMAQGAAMIMSEQQTLYTTVEQLRKVHNANAYSGDPRLNIPYMLNLDEEAWGKNADRLMKLHAELFDTYRNLMITYSGAVSLLAEVSKVKKVAAFTTRSRYMFSPEVCPDLLPFEEPDRYFDAIVTRSDVTYAKPHPEGFFKIARELDVPPERMVMVGDMPTDMQFLRQVGALGIGITQFPFADSDALYEAGADYVVESLGEVRSLLLGLDIEK